MVTAVAKALALATLLGACTDNGVLVTPVIDQPVNDSASAFPLDSITLAAAHKGAAFDITSATFSKGQTISLGGIPFGDDLVFHMSGQVGVSDVAYGETCAFSVTQAGAPITPHLYFARTVHFGQMAFTPLLRTGGASVTYHDGSAILVGGVDPGNANSAVTDVERFDPMTGDYRALATISSRIGSVVGLLGIGTSTLVTVIGGVDPMTGNGATFVETIESENPADRRVERIDDSQMARVGLTATTLTDGSMIVIGGRTPNGSAAADVDEVTLMNGAPLIRPAHDMLTHPRYDHTATRLGDDVGAPVLVVGGTDGTAPIAEAELFKPIISKFSTFHPTMNIPRSRHQAVRMTDGSVLILGGIDASNQPVSQIEIFTLDGGFVAPAGVTLPTNAGLVDMAVTTLPDGRVLITGGRATLGGPPVATAFIAQLNTDTNSIDVLATDSLTVPRAGHGATLLCDGTVLISGGTDQPAPAERYNPPSAARR
jgi:hypothetical protein